MKSGEVLIVTFCRCRRESWWFFSIAFSILALPGRKSTMLHVAHGPTEPCVIWDRFPLLLGNGNACPLPAMLAPLSRDPLPPPDAVQPGKVTHLCLRLMEGRSLLPFTSHLPHDLRKRTFFSPWALFLCQQNKDVLDPFLTLRVCEAVCFQEKNKTKRKAKTLTSPP